MIASSTSQQAEPITVTLAGVPGLTLVDVQPSELGPVQQTRLALTLQGTDVAPGIYEATLTIAARDGVDLGNRQIPLRFNLYVPVLTIGNKDLTFDLGRIRVDRLGEARQIQLDIHSSSTQAEPLRVESVVGVEEVETALSVDTLPPNKTTKVDLTLNLPQDLEAGEYEATIDLSTGEWVELTPNTVTVIWSVESIPWLELYGLPLVLGLLIIVLILISILVVRRLRVQRPFGALMAVSTPPNVPKQDYPLHRSDRRGRVFVGRRRRCQIRLNHPSIRPRHAAFFARLHKVTEPDETSLNMTTVKKPMCFVRNLGMGVVMIDGVRLRDGQVSLPIQDKARIKIGDFEFQWRAPDWPTDVPLGRRPAKK